MKANNLINKLLEGKSVRESLLAESKGEDIIDIFIRYIDTLESYIDYAENEGFGFPAKLDKDLKEINKVCDALR